MSKGDVHDHLIKSVFSEPSQAAAWLAETLPPPVVEALDLSALSLMPGSFVDDSLSERHTDLLFSARWEDRRPCLVYVLLEHQSTPDPMMAYRLLIYMTRIWERWRGQEENRGAVHLPLVIPVVIYHGEKTWKYHGLHQLMDCPEHLSEVLGSPVPRLDFQLVDLLNTLDEDIPGKALGRLALLFLRHFSLGRDLWRVLTEHSWLIEGAFQESGERALRVLLRYLYRAGAPPDPAKVRAFIEETLPQPTRDAFMQANKTYADVLIEKGVEEGLAKGVPLGRNTFAIKMLERKFGVLPEYALRMIRHADDEKLLRWMERLHDTNTLDELFSER